MGQNSSTGLPPPCLRNLGLKRCSWARENGLGYHWRIEPIQRHNKEVELENLNPRVTDQSSIREQGRSMDPPTSQEQSDLYLAHAPPTTTLEYLEFRQSAALLTFLNKGKSMTKTITTPALIVWATDVPT